MRCICTAGGSLSNSCDFDSAHLSSVVCKRRRGNDGRVITAVCFRCSIVTGVKPVCVSKVRAEGHGYLGGVIIGKLSSRALRACSLGCRPRESVCRLMDVGGAGTDNRSFLPVRFA